MNAVSLRYTRNRRFHRGAAEEAEIEILGDERGSLVAQSNEIVDTVMRDSYLRQSFAVSVSIQDFVMASSTRARDEQHI
jgi:hypothetical protein